MDRLQAMKVFTTVAETGSFSRASDALSMPRSSATVIIQRLEAHLKVRLLQRSTRRLSLTPEGADYYERCVRILGDVEEAEGALLLTAQGPRGKLRVDMSVSTGKEIVVPALESFQNRYPNIDLMLGFNDKPIDMLHEGVDCVVRVGALQDSSLVARRIGLYKIVTVASPDYLARYGIPESLDDLSLHRAINYFWTRTGRVMDWNFLVDGLNIPVKMNGNLAVNDTDVYLERCLKGIGIIQGPLFQARPHLESGTLVELFPQWRPKPSPISVVYPDNRHLSLTVRVFVDWLAEVFDNSPLL